MAGAAALCLPTLMLTQVSLIARPRPRSVLLSVPAPCLSSMAQPTSDCIPWVAGAYLTLPGNILSMAAKRQRAAAAWRRTGARAVTHGATVMCADARRGPRPRCGRRLVVEPRLTPATWPVHPDPVPSWGGFRDPG